MPLTTEGLIEEMRRFRSDKLVVVALIASMGDDDASDALRRLERVREVARGKCDEFRRTPRGKRTRQMVVQAPIWEGVRDLADEMQPWLAQVVEAAA